MKRATIVGGLVVAVLLVLLSPLASPHPDGLQRVAQDREFVGRAVDPAYGLLQGYTVPGVANRSRSTIAAGLVGVATIFVLTLAWGRWLRRHRLARRER